MDKTGLTKRESFLKKNNLPMNTSLSIPEIAKLAKVPVKALNEVRNRGAGAYDNLASVRLKDFSKNPDTRAFPASARLSKEQWKMARVYSFVNKAKGTFYGADADLGMKYGLT